ncbi:MAG: ATP-binding cassette domain-containing protein [Acidobacteriota bacterium]|nr:ATP-binding cassette domain-containing protein [Acidobacteriota bacterium]
MTQPLLEFENVTLMRGETQALRDFSLSIRQGEHVAILGPNGSGKSSFIKAITRECYPLQGSRVTLLGRDRWNIFELRAHLGIVSNDWMLACSRDYTGRETVLSGFFSSVGVWPYHLVTPEMQEQAGRVMEFLEITHLQDRNVSEMSSGEARRFLIARALAHNPHTLVFDEPSNSLDLHATQALRETMSRLARSGKSILLVTHTLPDIIPEIERVVMISKGRVFFDGTKGSALTSERLTALFRSPVELLSRDGVFHALY